MDIEQFNFTYYTDEEQATLAEISKRGSDAWQLFSRYKELERISDTEERQKEYSAKADEQARIFADTFIDSQEIRSASEQRYYESLGGKEAAILADAKKVLAASTKEDFEQIRAEVREKVKQAKIDDYEITCNYAKYFEYITINLRLQLGAYEYYELSNESLFKLIEKQAAKAYEPTAEDLAEVEQIKAKRLVVTDDINPLRKEYTQLVKPNYALGLVSKVSAEVFNPVVQLPLIIKENGQYMFSELVRVSKKSSKHQIVTPININYDEVYMDKPLNSYDFSVYEAICALYEAGNKLISIKDILEQMPGGRTVKMNITEKQKAEVQASITKMQKTIARVDYSNEVRAKFIKNISKDDAEATYTLEDNLLHIAKATRRNKNGTETELYQIISAPVLYSYDEIKGHLTRNNSKLLDIPLNYSKDNAALAGYLKSKIQRINRTTHISDEIAFKDIYDNIAAAKGSEIEKQQMARIRERCKVILDYWSEIDFIKGYEIIKKGNAPHSIKILPNRNYKELEKA